jgi:Tol biopolymer transport system component
MDMRRRGFTLAGLIVSALLAALGSRSVAGKGGGGKPPKDDPPPDPAIAYLHVGRSDDLMVMNDDGSNQAELLSAGNIGVASWSPNGQQLAFACDIQGIGVYVVNVDGTGLRKVVPTATQLPTHVAWSPAPTPDENPKIAFADQVVNPDGTLGKHDIFLVNLDGSGLLNLTQTPGMMETSPTWSPMADQLAVKVKGEDPADIVVYDLGLAGSEVTITASLNLTSDEDVPGGLLNDVGVHYPRWAKAQDKIAVTVHGGAGYSDIWIIDLADPANPINLTNTPDIEENGPSWSPDDTKIAYDAAFGSRGKGIYTIATDGSGATTRLVSGKYDRVPVWRRNP